MHDEKHNKPVNRFIAMTTVPASGKQHVRYKAWPLLISGLVVSCVSVLLILAFSPSVQEFFLALSHKPDKYVRQQGPDIKTMTSVIEQKEKSLIVLQRRLDRFVPSSPFLIINTTENEFVLMNRRGILRQGICSTGSYVLLDAGKDKQWIFKTPRGMFRIQNKTTSPVWHKPDWAFIEDGLPIPPQNSPDRYEKGVLGDYALILGHGYMLHGTLYKRLLGMPVTHGCVRLNDEDLEVIYKNLQIGSKVYIY
jgi:hypothetical protein